MRTIINARGTGTDDETPRRNEGTKDPKERRNEGIKEQRTKELTN